MKYFLCQIDPIVGDIDGNKNKILEYISKAREAKADLVIFPELAICGYPPEDLLDYPYFVKECLKATQDIADSCKGVHAIVGGIDLNPANQGRRLYNTAFVLKDGEIVHRIHKTLLPTYDIFTERRYFENNTQFQLINIKGKSIAISICEDIWDMHNDFIYAESPVKQLSALNPDTHINICASPYNQKKYSTRKKVISSAAKRMECTTIYLNQVGAQTGILFDGDSGVYNKKGDKLVNLKTFQEDSSIFDDSLNIVPIIDENYDKDLRVLEKALVYGIESYFTKMGFKKEAVLGSSGGIDSAVVQALGSKAIGGENLLAALMPSEFSSEGSVNDAIDLSNNLKNPYEIFAIKDIYKEFLGTLNPIFKDLPFSLAEENIQARSRGLILMAISNKTGRFLLNTSNKSEMAVGYTTLYGDMCGGLCPIGDVYKTKLYELAKYINKDNELIPNNIIYKAPSAELRPDQKDSDSLPEYEILDQLLEAYIEQRLGKHELIAMGFEDRMVNQVVNLVNRNDYKRWQAAPVLRVTTKDFSYGRRMPLVSKHP